MLVIGYSDFSADMNKYLETAAVSGLKILPKKKKAWPSESSTKSFCHRPSSVQTA